MEHADYEARSRRRLIVQSLIWVVVVITIFGGLRYPLLGFVVAGVMLMGFVGALVKGRYVCGWLCPRGALFDRVIKHVSRRSAIPRWLRSPWFRWPVFGALMGFMVYRISLNPADAYHWGRVFVSICIITTGIGIVLALAFHPRTWCAFCPMGTLQSAVGGGKAPLYVEEGCKGCRTCERACPMNLRIVGNTKDGRLDSADCLKCPECQLACPAKVLHF
ncbi:MAG: 4Fe-4S binding protein [Armatimonadota bacterium]|nr:MAG: 4Fe-4S binding protein [Armatimonadota bacterium]